MTLMTRNVPRTTPVQQAPGRFVAYGPETTAGGRRRSGTGSRFRPARQRAWREKEDLPFHQPDFALARSKSTISVQACWNCARSSVRITKLIIRPSSAISASRANDSISASETFEAPFDVVDGARSRHRSAIGWFVEDESHEGSRPHANYHDRFGYRQERVPSSRHRRDREGRRSEATAAQPGAGVLQGAAALPCRHGGLRYGPLLGA